MFIADFEVMIGFLSHGFARGWTAELREDLQHQLVLALPVQTFTSPIRIAQRQLHKVRAALLRRSAFAKSPQAPGRPWTIWHPHVQAALRMIKVSLTACAAECLGIDACRPQAHKRPQNCLRDCKDIRVTVGE